MSIVEESRKKHKDDAFISYRAGKRRRVILVRSGYSKIKLDSLRNFQNRHKGSLVDEIREDQVDLGTMSVKIHMEEEMFQHPQKKITNEEAQRVTSKLQNEFHPEKNYKRSEKLKVISDAQMNNLADSPGFVGHQSDRSIGQKIDSHLDEHDDHLDQKISFFQKTLADVAQAIISQKPMKLKEDSGI
ncbi:hypothetical protein MUK42_02971 [Musa troglodytarum]|uniref:Uncharacterized protein n=1 Tax=Musa troglodytarum TaxID=320322 RepID=A0A9E7G4B3_9LILI|nr:hypothetical protein MUK42_02971 [Musa troglodytarum]